MRSPLLSTARPRRGNPDCGTPGASPSPKVGRHSLDPLVQVHDTDTDTDDAESRGHAPPATPLPTGEWGRPPRPQPAETVQQRGRARTHLRRFFPPPPPPPPANYSHATPLTRRRFRSVVAELAIAAAVIASVALLSGGSASQRHRVDASLQWNSRALPVLTALVGDLTALQSDSRGLGDTPQSDGSALPVDASRLQRDVAAARALPEPPSAGLTRPWSAALSQLDAVVSGAGQLEAVPGGDSADRQAVSAKFEVAVSRAAQSLLGLASAMRG